MRWAGGDDIDFLPVANLNVTSSSATLYLLLLLLFLFLFLFPPAVRPPPSTTLFSPLLHHHPLLYPPRPSSFFPLSLSLHSLPPCLSAPCFSTSIFSLSLSLSLILFPPPRHPPPSDHPFCGKMCMCIGHIREGITIFSYRTTLAPRVTPPRRA